MTSRTVTFGGTSYPLVLPTIRDPRLHVAAVIITIHVLGQVGLHFRVSVPQILAAILTCAVIEVVLTFRLSRAFVWPASAMLTGSGVALILRVVGTPLDSPWATNDLWVFAVVAGLSLLSKYVIRYRGSHVFNPSNLGLVAAFVVLGSGRVEPLDFWWAPLDAWMLAAYAVILVGGLLITRRLHLLLMAAAFWVALAAGVGLLAASGHCMTANWAFAPVCGGDFVRVILTSPEVLIFLLFMITDPKTVPASRVGRVLFGVAGRRREHAAHRTPDQRVRDQGRPAREASCSCARCDRSLIACCPSRARPPTGWSRSRPAWCGAAARAWGSPAARSAQG